MFVRLLGIVRLVSLKQASNTESPMLVKVSGKVMLSRLLQYMKALLGMLVTPSGILMFVMLSQS